MKRTWNFSEVIKYYSVFIILVDILFIFIIGEEAIPNRPNSYDAKLKKNAPIFYEYLDYIGFRVITDPSKQIDPAVINKQFCVRFTSYIVYMLFSFYISGQY